MCCFVFDIDGCEVEFMLLLIYDVGQIFLFWGSCQGGSIKMNVIGFDGEIWIEMIEVFGDFVFFKGLLCVVVM